ncbi:MAG TPA: FeoA family protein [Kofleriaceae bacterium]
MPTSLAQIPLGKTATITSVDGPRAFRRRLLEMGLVPGVEVRVVTIAPLGDPLRIEIRGGQWSIRRAEAAQIGVDPAGKSASADVATETPAKALLVAAAP